MKPYPRYKPAGLPWLPSIPEHWEIKRLKNLFAERKEANRDGNNTKVLSLLKDVGVVPYEEKGNVGNKSKEDITQYKIARKGDLVLNSMNVIIGSVGVSEYDGCVSPVYYALRPREGINAKYYGHLFRLPNVQKTIRGRANGILEIRLRISVGALLDLPFPIPPPSEQSRIVRYLDAKTAAIADLIRAKEREIELLHERKQALVTEAVTGRDVSRKRPLGRDASTMRPNDDGRAVGASLPDFRPSGVPWIGDLPKGWQQDKITRIFSSIGSGTTPASGNAKFYSEATIPWMNSGDLYAGDIYIESTEKKVSEKALEQCSALKLYSGETIVVAMYGASIGNLGIANFTFCANQACCCLSKPRKGFDTKYLFYALSSCKPKWLESSKGGSQPNISQNTIRQTWLPVPPLPEQRRIVARLDAACSRLAVAEAAIRKQITLLQELRTRLVSDAVTGAVEVSKVKFPC